jgi:hypothetical protein
VPLPQLGCPPTGSARTSSCRKAPVIDYWNSFRDHAYEWLRTVVVRTRLGYVSNLHLMVVFLGLLCIAYYYSELGWRGIIFGTLGYVLTAMIVFWFILGTDDP